MVQTKTPWNEFLSNNVEITNLTTYNVNDLWCDVYENFNVYTCPVGQLHDDENELDIT